MTAQPIINTELETFRVKYPLNKNDIALVKELGSDGEVPVRLEVYSPPLLIYDHLALIKRYIREWRLKLKAQKFNTDTIWIEKI